MRVVIQRVREASVSVGCDLKGSIGRGFVIFLGIADSDTAGAAEYLAHRCANLRIFEDGERKMNLSLNDIQGDALVISQFTLCADTRKGNRPSFTGAARPDVAEKLYEEFASCLRREIGDQHVRTGVFRAMMEIALINDGPVTVIVDSK